ncbi:potassium voltage-gated channel subfamily H member 5-like [Bolinopsis microptera]|uniref:potassium voltage-gated channel subfamily H member 5-like n=1 Tax=Bolinopsis microptera TaxID=2820187 RepID=UPI00307B00CA
MEAYLTDLISTNTYARRVTKHHSYDYENNLVNLDIEKSLKATELQNVDHSYNENLEKMLTTIHGISQMFMLVNVTIPSFPVVFVSNEFTTFYRYSRNDVYLKDARLAFMMGPCTRKGILREIKHTLEASNENTLDYVLYTKDGIPVPTTIGLLRVKKPDHHNNDSYFAMTFDPFKSKDGPVEGEKDPEKELNVWLGEKSLVAPILKNKDKVLYTKHKSFKRKIFQRFTQLFESVNLLADSTIRKTWDWFILLASIWATFSVPVQVCFDEKIYYSKDIDLITDILFLIDMVMNFRTTFVNADGLVILTSKKMATHYLKGWFIVDLLTAVPWQFLQLIKPAKAFRYLKLTRVLRMAKVAFHLDEYTKNGPISLILIIMYFIMLGHLIACGWFWLGRSDYESNIAGWVTYHLQNNHFVLTPDIVGEQDLQEDFYSASLYFVMTIFCTVGFGNIAPWNVSEQIFCVIVMLIGAFFYAIIFGSATNIIMRMGAQQSRFLDQQKDLDLYTSVNKFPLDLKNRMEDYFYYHWFNSKGIEHSQMMQDWPRTLKEDTSLFLHRILFAEWPVFNEASTGCRRSLSSLVERHGFTPGDYIVHEEDCVDAVYFLVRGHVKILKDGDVIGILTMGDTFGEKWWPTAASGKANADIQAMTYAEIEVLTHERLKDILVKFPDYWSMWEQKLDITYELANRADQNIFGKMQHQSSLHIERLPHKPGPQSTLTGQKPRLTPRGYLQRGIWT